MLKHPRCFAVGYFRLSTPTLFCYGVFYRLCTSTLYCCGIFYRLCKPTLFCVDVLQNCTSTLSCVATVIPLYTHVIVCFTPTLSCAGAVAFRYEHMLLVFLLKIVVPNIDIITILFFFITKQNSNLTSIFFIFL